MISPVTWNSAPRRVSLSVSTKIPVWYRLGGSRGSGATVSSSGVETLYHSSALWPRAGGVALGVALGAALGARVVSPFMATSWDLPRELGGGAALGATAGAALYAPLYAVGGAMPSAAAGAVLYAPLYATAGATAGTTTGAAVGAVRGSAGLCAGRGLRCMLWDLFLLNMFGIQTTREQWR